MSNLLAASHAVVVGRRAGPHLCRRTAAGGGERILGGGGGLAPAPTAAAPPPPDRRRCHAGGLARRSYGVFAWGTSRNGLIPTPEVVAEEGALLEKERGGGATVTSGISLPTGNRTHVYDNPQPVDVGEAFGGDVGGELERFLCGQGNSAAVFSDGSCYVWGANDNGQLGLGHNKEVTSPTRLSLSSGGEAEAAVGVSDVVLGKTFSAAIDTSGNVHTFGYGGSAFAGMGWLGHGDGESCDVPRRVESLVEDGCVADDVAVGENHMTVLTTEGEVLTAGAGSYGRLGNLETTDQLFLEPVELLGGEVTTQISGGQAFTLALTNDGIVHGWGRNDKGQLGTGGGLMVDMYAMSSLPTPIEGQLENRTVVRIAAGTAHSACVTDRGELFLWGMHRYLEPELMTSLLHTKCVDVQCGENYTMALTEEGKLYSFGKGKTGVLGLAGTKKANFPLLVEGLAGYGVARGYMVARVSAGASHVACLVEDEEPGSGGVDGGGQT